LARASASDRNQWLFRQAPAPSLPIPRGKAGPGLLAHVLVSKYADHLPLYRQAEIYAREGVDLDRSTMADWVGQVSWLLQPLVEHIRQHVRRRQDPHRRHAGPGAGAGHGQDEDRQAVGVRPR